MIPASVDRRPLATLLFALPLVLLGCSADGGGDDVAVSSGSEQARVSGEVVVPEGVALPLDAYAFSDKEAQVIGQATEASVMECFQAYGFAAADAEPLPVGSGGAKTERHARRYAVADAEVAATYGYHPPQNGDVRRDFYEAHTAEELQVLVGPTEGKSAVSQYRGRAVPQGGCLGQAVAAVAAGDAAAQRAGEELVSSVQADAWNASLRDPRVLDVFAAWSACMAEAGYSYEAPMQANDDPAWQSPTASPEEIATATADVACKEKTDLVAVWSSVEAEHQAGSIAKHQKRFDAYRAVLDQQVADARAALN